MKILRGEESQRVFAILLEIGQDSSMVFIPPDQDPEARLVELTLEKTEGEVPFTQRKISVFNWLELTERMYQGLIKIGWQPKEARQILPRGGQNGSI